jgi:hypothetical protein
MKLLLVVGVAAVVLVILIAVFLSMRLGRSDDDHEELAGRASERRDRLDDGDSRRRDARAPRRSPAGQPRPGPSRSGQRPPAAAGDRRYRDRDGRRPQRDQGRRSTDDQGSRSGDYDHPQRRPGRYGTGPVESPTEPRRPVATGRSGSGRDHGGRRAGTGRGRPPTSAAYDTGPSPRRAADDFPSEPLHTEDFPSGEFPSGGFPAADFPSGEFPSADFPSGEFSSAPLPATPAARYPGTGLSTDEFPSEPLPAQEFPSQEFPAADFPSGEFPSADMPAARNPGRSPAPKAGRDRAESRRKPSRGETPPKGRSRPQRGKRDDDDWPSTEWDKLTDEQYWAELSADKPLATTARSPRPASEPALSGETAPPAEPRRPAARNGQRRSTAPRTEPSASAPVSPSAPPARELTRAYDRPTRGARSPQRPERPELAEHEAPTERLPIRPRQQPAAAAPPANGAPAARRREATGPHPAGEPSLAMLTSLASTPPGAPEEPGWRGRPARTTGDDPLTSPSYARPTTDSRSYRGSRQPAPGGSTRSQARPSDRPAADYGGGPYPTAGYGDSDYAHGAQPNGDYARSAYPDAGHADGDYAHDAQPNGDYARSAYPDAGHANGDYTNGARANGSHASGSHTGQDYRSSGAHHLPVSGHQAHDRTDPGYAYAPATAPPAPAGGASHPPDWYSAPPQMPTHQPTGGHRATGPQMTARQTPAQGNPYGSFVDPPATSYPSIPPAAYADQQPGASFPAHHGDQIGGYAEPAYDPAGLPAHPSGAGPVPAGYPETGYDDRGGYGYEQPGQAPYAGTYETAGYAPGYPAADHGADPYGPEGYRGYPAAQG